MTVASASKQLAVLAIALSSCAGLAQETVSLAFDGQQRTYAAHLRTPQDPAKSRPLLVVIRDEASRRATDPTFERLLAKSEEMGFVLVTPDAPTKAFKVDGAFVNAVVKDATERFRIDRGAVYVTALVDGGAVVLRVPGGRAETAAPVAWASEHLRVSDGRSRRGGTLAWCLDVKSRKLLSQTEWFCRP